MKYLLSDSSSRKRHFIQKATVHTLSVVYCYGVWFRKQGFLLSVVVSDDNHLANRHNLI